MGTGIFFPICALPIIIIISLSFNLKKHINSEETKLYNLLCVSNIIGLIIEILCSFACRIFDTHFVPASFILKSYLVYLIIWEAMFTSYIIRVSELGINKTYSFMHKIFVIFISTIIYLLPIEVIVKDNFKIHYTTGMAVNFSYFISFIYVLIIMYVLFKNIKNLKSKKYLPVFMFFIIGTISIAIQHTYPQLLLLTYAETLICLCMYFTIENPDLKMLEELYKNKKIIEKSNDDTSNFIFKMTQNIKKPVKEIIEITNNSSDKKMKEVNNLCKNLDYLIEDALDVSQMTTKKLKLYNTRYNPKNLFNEIKIREEAKLLNGVKIEYYISSNIPEYVYGDSIKIKQIVSSALDNSISHTNNGFISFEINTIIKYGICRFIIDITDNGNGIPIDEINDILSLKETESDFDFDKELLNLREIKLLTNKLGGNFMVRNADNQGTVVSITIDQKIVETNATKISKKLDLYEQSLQKNKKIIVVDDDPKELSYITSYLEKKDLSVNSSLFGEDVIERISNFHKFDLIILDDETNTYSAYEILKELKKNEKFNTPVVIMIDDNKEFIKLHFLQDGFADVIMKSKIKSELDRIIKRF